MSRTQTIEQGKLYIAQCLINKATRDHAERLQLIEAAAAIHSGADIFTYWQCCNVEPLQNRLFECARELNQLVEHCGIPYHLAISGLSREPLTVEEQKKNGVFYTDYRLATMMATACIKQLNENSTVADLAAGTGILLAAVAKEYQNKFPALFEKWIQSSIFAFDLSAHALRGAAAALLSMTQNTHAIISMRENWQICDSLFDEKVLKTKYDIIIGNPPWGKIKISRHTFIKQTGEDRIYGSDYAEFDSDQYNCEKAAIQEYSKKVKNAYNLIGDAEPDMYMAFLQRAVAAVKDGGRIVYLIPAGLIRSKGTLPLREYIIRNTTDLEYTLLDNRSRFFAIDTRFKFIMMSCIATPRAGTQNGTFGFEIYRDFNSMSEPIIFDVSKLREQRPDLTVPEVISKTEKDLFDRIYANGRKWGDTNDIWFADIVREVDMTNDRRKFVFCPGECHLPVVEGRMVQQHRFGAKKYVAGTGRSATWCPCKEGCFPQFFVPYKKLAEDIQKRSQTVRAGYCDIAGQTNERAMMSAIIPAGVVCGNKVPTVIFPNDTTGQMIYLWVGITNSFVFDWMIRRIISTTVNYFLLLSIPMPKIEIDSDAAQRIIIATKKLASMGSEFYTDKEMQELRTGIDVAVAEAYGLSEADMRIIMEDFPLLDRKQPRMTDCNRSITPDLLFTAFSKNEEAYNNRVEAYRTAGATAYIPAEMVGLTRNGGENDA